MGDKCPAGTRLHLFSNLPYQPHSPQQDHKAKLGRKPETGNTIPTSVCLKPPTKWKREHGVPQGKKHLGQWEDQARHGVNAEPVPGVAVLVLGMLSGAVDSISATRLT